MAMQRRPRQIGPFTMDQTRRTTMEYGYYYKAEFTVPFSDLPRTVRVWLPGDYVFGDPEKRFPVIYFSDGQNLVNRYLTAYGDWGLDKVWKEVFDERGISFIAVGIDCPPSENDRSNELTPPFPSKVKEIDSPMGDLFVNYIADVLRPLINDCFHTLPDKADTAIGGSSMGGIMAFYGGVTRHDVFGFSLDFSPAFLVYSRKKWLELLDGFQIRRENQTKFFFYVGGIDFESHFVPLTEETFRYLKKLGFTDRETAYIRDSRMKHHEDAWHRYLGDALCFWLDREEA